MLCLATLMFLILKKYFYKFFILFFIKKNLQKQLNREKFLKIKKNKKRILVPLIESNHYQVFQILLIAKALELRGAEVKVLLCGGTLQGCEIKSVKTVNEKDPCWKCKFNDIHLVKQFNLDVIYINDLLNISDLQKINKISKISSLKEIKKENNYNLFQIVQDSVVRYFYGKTNIDKELKIIKNHYNTSLKILLVSKKLFKTFNPNIILNNMQSYSSFAPLFLYFKKKHIKCCTLTMTAFNHRALVYNLFELLVSKTRYLNYLKARKPKKLSKKENNELDAYLAKRFSGEDEHLNQYKYMNSKYLELKKDYQDQKIYKNKKKIKIFMITNLHWDIGIDESKKNVFKNMNQWVFDNINFFSKRKQYHLFIKPHPIETNVKYQTLHTMEDVIRLRYKKIPDNITILKNKSKFNIFKYKNQIDLCLTYTGTLGLEMLLNKKKVIAAGNAPYNFLTPRFSSKNQYYNLILNYKKIKNPSIEDVRCFAYFFFIKTPIPWTLSDKIYAQSTGKFNFSSIEDLMPGKNFYFDHLLDVILKKNKISEAWN